MLTSDGVTDKKTNDHDIIYTLRTAHQNQTQLNIMADQKANILIGVMVIGMTLFLTKLSSNDGIRTELLWILVVFYSFGLVSVLLALLTLLPRLLPSRRKQAFTGIPNSLFFGFFTGMSEDAFVEHLDERLNSEHGARELLIRDLHQIGKVLNHKYTLLRYAYLSAVAGVVLPTLGYLVFLGIRS